ncbi:hypothetical protein JXA32_06240 [Candidatus Sumerlaeota bacterium]|nr:hypothetical protein [Candidatus Sumerlaeota bacterium]
MKRIFAPTTASMLFLSLFGFAAPDTVIIQGSLSQPDGSPLTGDRVYEVIFYDAESDGTQIGGSITGSTILSISGRFSVEITPPASALASDALYYQFALDSATSPDGAIDADDIFPERIKVNSVMFAQSVVQQGTGSELDADRLDGLDSSEFATTTDLADKADADHDHTLQSLSGAVTDAQVPDDITVDHAATADTATTAAYATDVDLALDEVLLYGNDASGQSMVNLETIETTGIVVSGALQATSMTINADNADQDSRIQGISDNNLLYIDASENRIGIGTAAPAEKLHVNGTALSANWREKYSNRYETKVIIPADPVQQNDTCDIVNITTTNGDGTAISMFELDVFEVDRHGRSAHYKFHAVYSLNLGTISTDIDSSTEYTFGTLTAPSMAWISMGGYNRTLRITHEDIQGMRLVVRSRNYNYIHSSAAGLTIEYQ